LGGFSQGRNISEQFGFIPDAKVNQVKGDTITIIYHEMNMP
jgi:hypothetical protein